MYTVGIDLGGTKIATALVDEQGEIVTCTEIPTIAAEGPHAVIRRMAQSAEEVMHGVERIDIRGVGIGAPGPLNPRTGLVFSPPNLPGWDAIPLRDEMNQLLQLPTFLENDANAATLAEATLGAGRGASNMVYITVSTGIGGGVVLDGQVRQGASGCAAEVGHMIIDVNGPACPCGNRGCLEALASGTAIRRLALERLGHELETQQVALLAAEGHEQAKGLLEDVYRWLGVGLVNVVQLFDPSVIIIGGGVAQLGAPLFTALQQSVDRNQFRSTAAKIHVVPAKLGTKAGVIGAALLPWNASKTAPVA